MNQKELFAEHLRSAMEQKQMKQVDLVHAADQAGLKVGKSHISQYVSGKTLPRADIAHFLADTYWFKDPKSPYFTFSIITLVLKIVFSSEVNNQATPILRTLFIEPIAPYWYLYTLFFLFCIVPYFKDKQLMKKIFVGAVFFKVLYVVWLCNFNLPDIVNKILANLVWFLLGMLISEIYMSKTLIKDWMNVVILGVGLGISWIYYSKPLENNVLQFVIGSCMIFPILYFFMSISPDKEGRFVHKLNQYFMPVYVLHTIIAAMLRSILLKIGIANFLLHFSIELIASILIPIVIYEIASKNWILLFWFEPVKALKMKRKKNEN